MPTKRGASGRLNEYMGNRHLFGVRSWVFGLAGIAGALLPDLGRVFYVLTGGKVKAVGFAAASYGYSPISWNVTHGWGVLFCWICGSCLCGLGAVVVLRKLWSIRLVRYV